MKSVLISIQPKWCEKIANREKSVEIRKTRPKIETPFKCYIYCTNKKPYLVWGDVFRGDWETEFTHLSGYNRKDAEKIWDIFNGKIIGEFVCDKLTYIEAGYDTNGKRHLYGTLFIEHQMCLPDDELHKYLYKSRENCGGWAWHISNLAIYDQPIKLDEFKRICTYRNDDGSCKYQKIKCAGIKFDYNPDNSVNLAECCDYIIKPPKSWCYVEELR